MFLSTDTSSSVENEEIGVDLILNLDFESTSDGSLAGVFTLISWVVSMIVTNLCSGIDE